MDSDRAASAREEVGICNILGLANLGIFQKLRKFLVISGGFGNVSSSGFGSNSSGFGNPTGENSGGFGGNSSGFDSKPSGFGNKCESKGAGGLEYSSRKSRGDYHLGMFSWQFLGLGRVSSNLFSKFGNMRIVSVGSSSGFGARPSEFGNQGGDSSSGFGNSNSAFGFNPASGDKDSKREFGGESICTSSTRATTKRAFENFL